ncbi:MAG: LamG domain-containing protein, partial [Planctomycetes bacterium]|nr:LamG domain-containing protein [Planctomycetota bacterium]
MKRAIRSRLRVRLQVLALIAALPALSTELIALRADSGEAAGAPPWQSPYAGEDATGADVIALWSFDAPFDGRDGSGNGHELALRGDSRIVAGGKFGGCLESHPSGAGDDRPQGALATNHAALSPPGAFTLEAWFRPKPEMSEHGIAFLLDKKYYHYAKDIPQANHDYCLYLAPAGRDRRRIVAYLGYGSDSAQYVSREIDVSASEWRHVAFTYDGRGTGRFFLDGEPAGKTVHAGRGAISPGPYGLAVGDRYGSIHQGFPGWLDEVRISSGIPASFEGGLELELGGGRAAFLRMEKPARISLSLTNGSASTMGAGEGVATLAGVEAKIRWPELKPGETHVVELPVDTALRPDAYQLSVVASARAAGGSKEYRIDREIEVHIAARRLPGRMPVILWGTGGIDLVEKIGFTHQLVSLADYARVWSTGAAEGAAAPARTEEHARMLDEYLARDLGAVVRLDPGRWLARDERLFERFRRVDRAGDPYEKSDNICAAFPEVRDYAFRVGASVARSYGEFPALRASLIHTEIRDGTRLCFHEHDREALRKATGLEIPPEAAGTRGVRYASIPGFPEDRVVPDDHPLLVFYRWFWKDGDGWNDLHTQVHRGLRSAGRADLSAGRADLWTFFDPAVRAPSLWGSGGGVDVISQWSYSYPDPLKVGQAADELFAMAAGRPGAQVMKMTQIIWYRSQTAPHLPEDEAARAAWEREIPDAKFITISPDHLREAFWCMISRPVRGIMYHGWGSLVDAGPG